MSFQELKAKRDARLGSDRPKEDKQEKVSQDSDLYPELKDSGLQIKTAPGRGRGLWTTKDFKPGSKLLSLNPHVYTVSSKHLASHCSYCTQQAQTRRCTQCRAVSYCSTTCQKDDWKLHKEECKAIQRWTTASPDSHPPADSIRAIGRLLWQWKIKRSDSAWWREVQAMQSNRESLSLATQEAFTHFAQSLVLYLGVNSPDELREYSISTAREMVDLFSRFTTNSFTLTSPSLDSIGVSISPVPALINHSCRPNAVVVFPKASTGKPPTLEVISILPISSGDEVLAAYIDVTLPKEARQKALQETYNFTCQCTDCVGEAHGDMRSSYFCPRCKDGRVTIANIGLASTCSKCDAATLIPRDTDDKIRVATEGLDKAEKLQWEDSKQALKLAENLSVLLAPIVPATSHPRLALIRLHQSLLLSEPDPERKNLDDVIKITAQIVAAIIELLPLGHPTRGIAIAELGKLLCADEPEHQETAAPEETFPPRGYSRLVLAKDTLVRAVNELKVGFGEGGGDLGEEVRKMLENVERELAVYKRGVNNLRESTRASQKTSAAP